MAKDKGFFKENGLDVTINPGGPANSSVKLVAAGTDDFGVTGSSELLQARAKGIPIVAVAVVFKRSPVVYIAKKISHIEKPEDFIGKKVALVFGENTETEYRAMLKNLSIDANKIKEIAFNFNLVPFLEDKIDVIPAYAFDQPISAEMEGAQINRIFPSDHGVTPYGDVLFTRDKMIEERPEIIERFLRAFVQAWKWCMENPEEAIDILLKNTESLNLNKTKESATLHEAFKFVIPKDEPNKQIGVMEHKRWEDSLMPLKEFNLVDKEIDLTTAYNSNFIDKVYK